MHSLRLAFIAAILLFAAFEGSASAAHCRSEHVLVLDESTGQFHFGSYDPNRLSWEPVRHGAELAWGFSCQEGGPSSGRSLTRTHILSSGSNLRIGLSPSIGEQVLFVPAWITAVHWSPDPRPPRAPFVFA